MTHPPPESLGLHALGDGDSATGRHVERCATCRAEVARLREATALLRGEVVHHRFTETAACLEESLIADFVAGGLAPASRAPVVDHLLGCARCRSAVRAAGRLLADPAVVREIARPVPADRQWRRWAVGFGVAAAATLAVIIWPSDRGTTDLREPTLTSTVAPEPIAPRMSVARVDRLVWSEVPGAERYRLRVYDGDGSVLWTAETADTVAAWPGSVVLLPGATYFWRVEAEAEWQRWTASDLIEFHLTRSRR